VEIVEVCPCGCQSGQCTQSCCSAGTYWDPDTLESTDQTAQQYDNGTPVSLAVGLRLEISETTPGANLQLRVCKTTSTALSNDVYLQFEEWMAHAGLVMFKGTLPKSGNCTEWADMTNETSFAQGDVFGGDWMAISPASSSDTWGWSCANDDPSPTGTCWTGATGTSERTCK